MNSIIFAFIICINAQINGIPYSCDSSCKLPNCKCATNEPPVANPPQFIVITFDDSVQEAVMPQAKATFANRKNPNGCNAKATWFAQVLYSNPLQLTKWYAEGNEIADHSVTHVTPFAGSYAELEGMRAWANAFAGIPRGKIRGVRFPFRSYSVESMELVAKMGFEYDSSMASLGKPIWPYTLDNGVVTECLGANPICGKKVNAKGLWELPMYGSSGAGGFHLMDPYNDFSLANPIPPQQVTDDLMNAFNQHYNSNKAPFGVYMHPLWIGAAQQGVPDGAPKLAAINKFLDQAMANTNVWLVTNYQIIQYMRNPVSAAELGNQEYMKCGRTPPANICNGLSDVGVESCPYNSFQTCYGCPGSEPSLTNPIPERNSQRCLVPDTCDSLYWDPVGCKCLCDAPACAWNDTSRAINLDPKSLDSLPKNPNNAATFGGIVGLVGSLLALLVFN